jgi:hypothetical protein
VVNDGEAEQQDQYDVLVVGGALVSAAGLCLSLWGYLSAAEDCRRFGQSDFFACGASAAMTVIGDLTAALAFALLIATTPIRPPRWLPFLGRTAVAAAGVAALASPLRAIGQADAVSRVIAVAWLVMGLWLLQASRTAPVVMRSTLGAVLGVTLVVSGVLQALGEERPFPIGGALFSIAFAAWAIRLTSRLLRSWRPPAPEPDSVFGFARDILVALGIVLMALPAWFSSTVGVAPIGDPAVMITVANRTSHAIDFYVDKDLRQYATRVDPGSSKDISTLAHGAYSTAAADPAGNLVFCGRYTDNQLRLKLRYVITVVDDPSSCR